jgi:CRISPR-associated protein Csm5
MEVTRFRVKVLTPVHIGTGKTMAPEEYFIRDRRLVRFRPEVVMRSWTLAERQAFENRLRAGALEPAWDQLRNAAAGRRDSWLYEIAAGEGSARELGAALDPSRRRGDVFLLPWNLARREVIVPGSAIKGALRTAFVTACVQADLAAIRSEVERRKHQDKNWRKHNDAWRAMEEKALRIESRGRNQPEPIDPLQMLKVSDAAVPARAVQVDQAQVRKRNGGAAAQKIQIHCERLLSAADGQAAEFSLEIRWDRDRALDRRRNGLLGRKWEWRFLVQAANHYFHQRLAAERDRFPFLGQGAAQWLPQGAWWEGGRLLLRIGRFSHFESLSVDDLRDGYNLQRRVSIKEGDSRTVVVVQGRPVSFGWVLLEPES